MKRLDHDLGDALFHVLMALTLAMIPLAGLVALLLSDTFSAAILYVFGAGLMFMFLGIALIAYENVCDALERLQRNRVSAENTRRAKEQAHG